MRARVCVSSVCYCVCVCFVCLRFTDAYCHCLNYSRTATLLIRYYGAAYYTLHGFNTGVSLAPVPVPVPPRGGRRRALVRP